jgi:hypothetical protein
VDFSCFSSGKAAAADGLGLNRGIPVAITTFGHAVFVMRRHAAGPDELYSNFRRYFMSVRYFALIIGIAFLLAGVLGFVPALVQHPAGGHDLAVDQGHGYLLGLFPVNVLHNIVHLLVGLGGVLAYRSFDASRMFSRILAIFYGVLAIMGLIPAYWAQTTFGLIPIHGNDVWLHAATAALAAYFGWAPIGHTRRGDDYDTVGTPHLR